MSITLRLMLGLSVMMVLFWGATALVSRTVFTEEIDEILSDTMQATARHLMPLVLENRLTRDRAPAEKEDDEGEVHELQEHEDDFAHQTEEVRGYLAFEVRDAAGRVIMRSEDARSIGLDRQPKPGFTRVGDVLAFTLMDADSNISLTLLEPAGHRAEAIGEATLALLWPLAYLVPLMAIAIWALTRFSLAPVLGLSAQIAERGGANLAPLDRRGQPAELKPMVTAVDRLMERLRTAMDAERVFAANAAHELRTPIAGALAQIQRLKAELGDAKGAARVVEVEAKLKHLIDFAEKLLQLSRAEAGLGRPSDRINMTPILQAVLGEFTSRLTNPVRIEVDNRLGQDLMVAMDADAFAIVIRNLLENAALHGDKDRPIRLTLAEDWSIEVANDGPVVPPETLATLTQRHKRGESRSAGSGLGLAIVATILKQSEGALVLTSPAPGRAGGFAARVVLP